MTIYEAHWSEEYMSKDERNKLHDLLWKYSKWKYEKRSDFDKRKITVDGLLNEISATVHGERK